MTGADGPLDADQVIKEDEERVRREYARRSNERLRAYYTRNQEALSRANDERRQLLLAELDQLGDRLRLRVLDVGCGFGGDLAYLASAGFAESNLAGVDVLAERVAAARSQLPAANIQMANGAMLPFGDGDFDAVTQSVALSSVVDPVVRLRIATEMLRVTRPGGLIISYDMAVIGDRNPHLVAIDRAELGRLFGRSRLSKVLRVTLLLPVASRAPSWLRRIAGRVPQLRSHLHAVVTRESD